MSYITCGHEGLKAVENKDWTKAINLLDQALAESSNPDWLLARSQAYQETKENDLALADAENAYVSATERQQIKSRSQMALAQYRRAVILGRMKRYADADACCVWSQQLVEGKTFRSSEPDEVSQNVDAEGRYLATSESALSTTTMPVQKGGSKGVAGSSGDKRGSEWSRAYVWRSVMLRAMEKLPADDEGRKIHVRRIPEKHVKKPVQKKAAAGIVLPPPSTSSESAAPAIKVAETKFTADYYQTDKNVYLTIYIKGCDKHDVKVDIREKEIYITGLPEKNIGSAGTYWTVLELNGQVDLKANNTVRINPYKIEIVLVKADPSHRWGSWGVQRQEGKGEPPNFGAETKTEEVGTKELEAKAEEEKQVEVTADKHTTTTTAATTTTTTKPPAYPTSSRKGPKNWEKMETDEDEEDAKGQNVDDFFKVLYKNSTPDQQRAMMKSFYESNGTALSTDWSTVSKGPVETKPPEGMEAKKWD